MRARRRGDQVEPEGVGHRATGIEGRAVPGRIVLVRERRDGDRFLARAALARKIGCGSL